MPHAVFADLVLLLHAAFIVFVAGGGMLLWRWPRLVWVHLPAAAWGALNALTGWPCPLTPLENHLRLRALQAGDEGSIVRQYLLAFIYPEGLTRPLQVALGGVVVCVTVTIYVSWWRRQKR